MYAPVLPISLRSIEELSPRERRLAEERFYQDYSALQLPRWVAPLTRGCVGLMAKGNALLRRAETTRTADGYRRCAQLQHDCPG